MIKNKIMSTENKLTAMQEFIDRLKNDFGFVVSNNVTEMYLEKEKQQIIDAGNVSQQTDFYVNYENVEHYYNETYKK